MGAGHVREKTQIAWTSYDQWTPNTVFARALADTIQRAHKVWKSKHAVDLAITRYILNACTIRAILLHNGKQCIDSFSLQFHYKGMLENWDFDAKNPACSNSLFFSVKCSTCVVSQKLRLNAE